MTRQVRALGDRSACQCDHVIESSLRDVPWCRGAREMCRVSVRASRRGFPDTILRTYEPTVDRSFDLTSGAYLRSALTRRALNHSACTTVTFALLSSLAHSTWSEAASSSGVKGSHPRKVSAADSPGSRSTPLSEKRPGSEASRVA